MLHRGRAARVAGLQVHHCGPCCTGSALHVVPACKCTTAATEPTAVLQTSFAGAQERGEAGEEQLRGGQCWDPGREAMSACCMQSLQLPQLVLQKPHHELQICLSPTRYRPPACGSPYPRLRPQLCSATALPPSLHVSDSMKDDNLSTLELGLTLHPGCWLHDLHHAPPPKAPAPAWPLPLHHLQEA